MRTQKELKALYEEIIKNEVWTDSESMQRYEMKTVSNIVELKNGDIITFDKPTIETHFCFGYGYCGVTTQEDENRASNMARYAETNEEYFINENIDRTHIDRNIERLEKCKRGLKNCYVGTKYPRKEHNECKLKFYTTGETYELPEEISNVPLRRLDNDDIQTIIDGLNEQKANFVKRLNTYLKKYGLSKIDTWTYLSD